MSRARLVLRNLAASITVASLAVASYRITVDALPVGLPGTIVACACGLGMAWLVSLIIAHWIER
jgi:hypothetical protein